MTNIQEHQQTARDNLATLIQYLGIEAQIQVNGDDESIKLTVSSEDAGRIIGRKGRTLSAIQLLLNSMMRKDDEFESRIEVSIDGYRKPERGARNDRNRNDRRPQRSKGRNDRGRDGGRSRRGRRDEGAQADAPGNEVPQKISEPQAPQEEQVAEPQAPRKEQPAESQAPRKEQPAESQAPRKEQPAESQTPREERAPREERRPRQEGRERRERPGRRDRSDRREQREPRARRAEEPCSPEENERKRRQQALDAAKEVKRWGDSVSLRGMNEEDRKIIMNALAGDSEVVAVEGEVVGPNMRRMTIRLKQPA